MGFSADRRRVLLVVLVASMAALGGCGLGSQSAGTPTDPPEQPEYPEVVDSTTASLSEENASAFLTAITDDSGELTADGQAWVNRLETVAELGAIHRDAVARSIAANGLGDQRLTRLDELLSSPVRAQQIVLREGLRDRSGDGLLDGEAELLGLDSSEEYPTVSATTRALAASGYDNRSIAYLDQLATHAGASFQLAQLRGFGLVNRSVANGSVTAADTRTLRDRSGDGLLNGTARQLGLDPTIRHESVGTLAEPLADGGYTDTDIAYLTRLGNISDNQSLWEQASTLDLLSTTADEGSIGSQPVAALEPTEAGLLSGFAVEIGVGNRTDNESVRRLTTQLAAGGFEETDIAFLERAVSITESRPLAAQARVLSLFERPSGGTATSADRAALADSSGDGLLDPMANRLGVNPQRANPQLANFTAQLATGGYDETELSYLDRIQNLSSYKGNKYERWAQARQLGLLGTATASGTITDDQHWQLHNADDDHLLNGMERQFGSNPNRMDSSGDGYSDHLLWGPMRDLGLSVSPTEANVYVELDAVEDQSFPGDDQLGTIQRTLRSEPTAVPPISVNFYRCSSDRDAVSGISEMQSRAEEYRTMTGLGFQYLLIVGDSIDLEGEAVSGVAYVSRQRTSWMMVDGTISRQATTEHETSVIAHELGHSMGILDRAFDGVDSRAYSSERYTSVMNYNYWRPVTFSTDSPFNDYQQMADQSFGSHHQNHSRLNSMWHTGSVEEDLSCRRGGS